MQDRFAPSLFDVTDFLQLIWEARPFHASQPDVSPTNLHFCAFVRFGPPLDRPLLPISMSTLRGRQRYNAVRRNLESF